MLNITCDLSTESQHHLFYAFNEPCPGTLDGAKIPTTTILYAFLAGISMIIALVVHFCYNSVIVLQYRIFVPAISNSLWIVYFIVVSTRAIVLSILYARKFKHSEGYFLTSWIFGSFEIFMLCVALNYQRRFRSIAKVKVDPDDRTSEVVKMMKIFTVHEGVLLFQFVVVITAIILFRYVGSGEYEYYAICFWIYVAFSMLVLLNALVISILIGCKGGFDQPALITKIYFVGSVLLCTPERVPTFVWEICAGNKDTCWAHHFDLFDLFLVFKILSVLFLFRALYKEYHRLKHECQYALLNEVQGYSFQQQ